MYRVHSQKDEIPGFCIFPILMNLCLQIFKRCITTTYIVFPWYINTEEVLPWQEKKNLKARTG
jgi:hypothetical protein